ncbi:MAG: hypothetical protein E7208_02515 [Clostridium butyricum]|nr:hypothetical protein [Clostridium butyricum]
MNFKRFFKNIRNSILMKIEYEVFNDEFICIRLTKEEKEIIKKLANCQKSNIQEFVKYIIFSKYIDDFIR